MQEGAGLVTAHDGASVAGAGGTSAFGGDDPADEARSLSGKEVRVGNTHSGRDALGA